MDPRSEVLLRQIELFTDNTLLVGLPADELLTMIPTGKGWSWFASDSQILQQRYPEKIHLGTTAPSEVFSAAVIFLPKSKELTDYLLQATAATLKTNCPLYLVGEKKAGIERAAKQLTTYGKAIKLDSARHCQLWKVTPQEAILPPKLGDFAQTYHVGELNITSFAGVFSHGKLDIGTSLLLQHLTNIPQGKILDFGCGAGVIGSLIKQQHPKTSVYLQDVDAFAIASTEQTLQQNQLEATTLLADGINAAPTELSMIITNPPFHQGVKTNYETTEQLLTHAVYHLIKGGELRLVANSFLKYQPIIEQAFGNCQVLAENNGFKIYSAIK